MKIRPILIPHTVDFIWFKKTVVKVEKVKQRKALYIDSLFMQHLFNPQSVGSI